MLKELFAGFRSARRSYRSHRPSHFGLTSSRNTTLLEDLPASKIEEINAASRQYFENNGMRDYWLNKPYSEPQWAPLVLHRFSLLLTALRMVRGTRVLDFGCGAGWTSVMLARLGADVVGVDIAPAAIELCNQQAERDLRGDLRARCRFYSFDGFRLPFPDSSFDYLVIFEALHHLPNPTALFKEFSRVLSPHGRLGFAEPGVGHSDEHSSHMEEEKGILEKDLDLEQLENTARACGFRDMELVIQGPHPNTLNLPMKRARWFLRGASWLAPANALRYQLITAPIGILTKSPYHASSLFPISHAAVIRPSAADLSVPAGSVFQFGVRVTNPSETVWLCEASRGVGYVRLGASLLTPNGSIQVRDFGRIALPRDVGKSETVDLVLQLVAPAAAASYILRFDMVNEGVCWFSETGSSPADIPLLVT